MRAVVFSPYGDGGEKEVKTTAIQISLGELRGGWEIVLKTLSFDLIVEQPA